MTPLAHEIMRRRIAKDSSKMFGRPAPGQIRHEFPDPYEHFKDVHFFDVTEVYELSTTMTFNSLLASSEVLAFLPAPRTWIEWRVPGTPSRMAFRLVETGENSAYVHLYTGQPQGIFYRGVGLELPLVGSPDLVTHRVACLPGTWGAEKDLQKGAAFATAIYALLALINSPKLIGQRTHQPHRGLERALLKDRDFAAGKFPLHAWKEIRLEVQPPKQAGDTEQEAHFTGRRAYHFVRQYLRMQGGQLVLVSSHWKGDPALGIERARYTVGPGRAAA